LDSLEKARTDAILADRRATYAAHASEFINECDKLDTAVTAVKEVYDQIVEARLKLMEICASEGGMDVSRAHSRLRINLSRCIMQKIGIDAPYLPKPAREIFRGRIAVVAKSTLDGLLSDLDPEERSHDAA